VDNGYWGSCGKAEDKKRTYFKAVIKKCSITEGVGKVLPSWYLQPRSVS
jgi:hypothetical protein